jgi:chromosome segregation ATPase
VCKDCENELTALESQILEYSREKERLEEENKNLRNKISELHKEMEEEQGDIMDLTQALGEEDVCYTVLSIPYVLYLLLF